MTNEAGIRGDSRSLPPWGGAAVATAASRLAGVPPSPPTSKGSKGGRQPTGARRGLVVRDILDHAGRLFAEQGFDGTTLQDIADAMGVGRSALYYYFKSKDEILATLVGETSGRALIIVKAVRDRSDLDTEGKLSEMVRSLVLDRAENPGQFRMLDRTESSMPPKLAAEHRDARRQVLAELVELIHEGVASGVFRALDERVAALSILGMCNWVAWWHRPGADQSTHPIADQIAQSAVDVMRHNGPGSARADDPSAVAQRIKQDLDHLQRLLARQ